ncbi:hypothetical protein VPNG_09672 [Cytospora leucostoma]|uniref:Rho-GAP domain-containing protein n=1 Tax=Cytospora leucostoma TaxID=1230097 RepID=A0A423VMR3_9PEZI|nr:hypothetical protein VPNG_09672 [Cytospora leucostoma]
MAVDPSSMDWIGPGLRAVRCAALSGAQVLLAVGHTNPSVSSGCIAASNAISKTSPALRGFIREVREARTELDAVLAELHSLDGVLDILKDDASIFPADLAPRTTPLIEHCGSIINQIEGYMHVCNGLGLSQRDKKYRWMAIRGDMEKLRLTLEGYKSTLAVVTDLVGLESHSKETETMSIDSHSSNYHHAVAHRHAAKDDMKDELTRVMGDMGGLRSRLQGEFRAIYAVTNLESYLDAMQRHATDLGYRLQVHDDDNKVETAEQQPPPRAARAANPEDRHYTHSGSSSVGDAPDSAIDIYDDGPPSPYGRISKDERERGSSSLIAPTQQGRPEPGPDQDFSVNLPTVEINDCPEDDTAEGSEVVPAQVPDPRASTPRAPTPPPKASRRSNSVYSTSLSPFTGGGLRGLPGLGRPQSAHSVSETDVLDSEGNPVVPQRVSSLRSQANSADDNNSNDDDTRSTLGSLRGIRPPPPGRNDSDFSNFSAYMGGVAVTTTITGGSSAGGSSIDEAAPPPIKDGRSRASLSRNRLFGRKNSFSHTADATDAENTTGSEDTYQYHTANTKDAGDTDKSDDTKYLVKTIDAVNAVNEVNTVNADNIRGKPIPLSTAGASIRSSGSRLSSMFRKVNLWSPKIPELEAPAEEAEPDDIFGVSLKKSMQMASGSVKTHHDGSKGSSRREFPRCVLTCVQFIKKNDGVVAPNIFGAEMISLGGSGGNGGSGSGSGSGSDAMVRVASLKESFSTAPHYGEGNIDWSRYTVYDAAELIVLFLQQLRRPLINETVAKRWIVLSKQATLPGSMGMRLDSCIDFWDEALLGVRGAARSLFKLLLNLLGDIADAADVNDMTAERLASRMLNPLMHLSAAKYTTDYMLGNSPVDGNGATPHQAGNRAHLLGFDNVIARAAHSDLSAAERVQRQQALMASTLNGLTSTLNGLPSGPDATGTTQPPRGPDSDASLSGVGAQFGAHSSGLSGAPHAHRVQERS